MLVDIDMSKLSDKTERLNICLPSRALRRLDSLAANLAKTIFWFISEVRGTRP